MALYLGNSGRLKINLGGVVYRLNLFSATPITNNGWLLSSDDYILQDSNGIYLIPKDETEIVVDNVLISSDDYVLTDSNGIYLVPKDYVEIVIDNAILSSDNYILQDSNGVYLTY